MSRDRRIPVEDWIDLHTFRPGDVPEVVDSYLQAAWEAGYREVRIVHGRGIGVQREAVRHVLAAHPLVRSCADAPPDRGGWGATLAVLGARRDTDETAPPEERPEPDGSPLLGWLLMGVAVLLAVALLVVAVVGLLAR